MSQHLGRRVFVNVTNILDDKWASVPEEGFKGVAGLSKLQLKRGEAYPL